MKAFITMHTLKSKSQEIRTIRSSIFRTRLTTKNREELTLAVNLVAAIQGVSPDEILNHSSRQAHIALARQLAMYMTHVALGNTLTKTGQLFRRDRTTVSHACARIEDMRDDPEFDHALTALEYVLNFAADNHCYNNKQAAQ